MSTIWAAVAVVASVLNLSASSTLVTPGAVPAAASASASAGYDQGQILFNASVDAGAEGFQTDIFTVAPSGGPAHKLTSDAGENFAGGYSRSGALIAFVHGGVVGRLWTMRADGSRQRPLGTTAVEGSCPRFAPDGKHLAYRAGDFGEIWIVAADGTGAHRISGSADAFDQCPSWSPDGSRIVFVRYRGFSEADVWVMGADGTNARQLTTDGETKTSAAWSPDGRRIAYDRAGDIWLMHPDGRWQRAITQTAAPETEPVWSPGSDRIVHARASGATYELWISDVRGHNLHALGVAGSPTGWRTTASTYSRRR